MKLVETKKFARDLEIGLGEVYQETNAFPAKLRLAMGVCGVVSVAIAEHLEQRGFDAQAIISKPELDVDPSRQHVFVMVDGDERTILDATYFELLDLAGLSPAYAFQSRRDVFPQQKIATFTLGQEQPFIDGLTVTARTFMENYVAVKRMPWMRLGEFNGMTDAQIAARFGEVWNPANFSRFAPSEGTAAVGKELANYIDPRHVQLVA